MAKVCQASIRAEDVEPLEPTNPSPLPAALIRFPSFLSALPTYNVAVAHFSAGFGGLAPVTRGMAELDAALVGQEWAPAIIDTAHSVLAVSARVSSRAQ